MSAGLKAENCAPPCSFSTSGTDLAGERGIDADEILGFGAICEALLIRRAAARDRSSPS